MLQVHVAEASGGRAGGLGLWVEAFRNVAVVDEDRHRLMLKKGGGVLGGAQPPPPICKSMRNVAVVDTDSQ